MPQHNSDMIIFKTDDEKVSVNVLMRNETAILLNEMKQLLNN